MLSINEKLLKNQRKTSLNPKKQYIVNFINDNRLKPKEILEKVKDLTKKAVLDRIKKF